MLVDRRRGNGTAMFTNSETLEMSASEIADATMRGVDSLRKAKKLGTVINLVKILDLACKGECKTHADFKKREAFLDQAIEIIDDMGSYDTLRRQLVPAVRFTIYNSSFISERRQSKVAKQWAELIGMLDTKLV